MVASSPFAGPSRLRRSLARSRETRFTRPNRRACSQAIDPQKYSSPFRTISLIFHCYFHFRLLERGYLATILRTYLSEIKFADKQTALKQIKKSTRKKKLLPFVTQYHPALPSLTRILIKNRNGTLYKTSNE